MPLKRDYKWYSLLFYYLFFRGIKFLHRKLNLINPWFWLTKSDTFRMKFGKQGGADFHERYEKEFNEIKRGHALYYTDRLLNRLFIPIWALFTTVTCLKMWTVFQQTSSAVRYLLLVFVLFFIFILSWFIIAAYLGSESGRRINYFKEFEKFEKRTIAKYALFVLLIAGFSFLLMICLLLKT